MYRTALPFPILPGKSEQDAMVIVDGFNRRRGEYEESRRRLGITLERAYLQKTPMGSFIVAYVESNKSFLETNALMAQSDLDIDRFFISNVLEINGVDLTAPPAGPPPETVAVWTDSAVTQRGRGFAFCAPLIPGAVERARTWATEAFGSPEMTTSRRALQEYVEVVGLVHTPQGEVTAIYLEGADPLAANQRFAASTEPWDLWFKDQLKTIYPPFIDFSQPVPGVQEIFDSSRIAVLVR